MSRIAHELINQLTVLNLVGHDILSASGTGPAAIPARDSEIFERAINDATLLAERLADYLAGQQDNGAAEHRGTISERGRVVATLLAERLADHLAGQQDNGPAEHKGTISERGQVVRLLRSVNKPAVKLPPR